jgi:hypothetical protein
VKISGLFVWLVADIELFREKRKVLLTESWWLISQANRLYVSLI